MEYVWIVLKICLIVVACFQIIRWVARYIGNKYKTENYTYLIELLNQPRDKLFAIKKHWVQFMYFNGEVIVSVQFSFDWASFALNIEEEKITFKEFYWWEGWHIYFKLRRIYRECLKDYLKNINSDILKDAKKILKEKRNSIK